MTETERLAEGLHVDRRVSWRVRTQKEINYEVRFRDNLFQLGRTDLLEAVSDSVGRQRRFVVVDSNVDLLHGKTIRGYFEHHDVEYAMVVIKANETVKDFDTAALIVEALDKFGIARRQEPVIVIGGGVLMDIVGLVASLYRRGTPFVRVPTTLIGLVDAGVGAKTGVNFNGHKNRLGTYTPADLTLLDRSFLSSLDRRHIGNGLAEILKVALIKDFKLFELLEEHGKLLLDEKFQGRTPTGDRAAVDVLHGATHGMLEELQPNLWEADLERCVDYGHTFSPTLEMRALPSLLHGEAVCVDMALTTVIAYHRGLLNEQERDRIFAVMSALELPTWHPKLDPEVLASALEATVQHRDGQQRLPLPVGIGNVIFVNDVTGEEIKAAATMQRDLDVGLPRPSSTARATATTRSEPARQIRASSASKMDDEATSRKLSADVVVIGGGAAGCVLAARLSEDESCSVLLLEAGPDYGPYRAGRWPDDLLDCRSPARSHDWDPDGSSEFSRARVIGGSSVSNACWTTVGAPPDYDAWSSYSGGAWDNATLAPYVADAMRELRVRDVPERDRGPWHQAIVTGATQLGLPPLADVNGADAKEGAGWVPLNAIGHTRWNAAFAYLDPARNRPNLRVVGDAMAVRLLVRGERATGVEIVRDGRTEIVTADKVVLASGTYGNPPLLMRSGIGPEPVLGELDAPVVLPLSGVGANLIDHSKAHLELTPGKALVMPDDDVYVPQALLKARSNVAADDYWDMHIVPTAGPGEDERGRFVGPLAVALYVFVLAPRSRGVVRARSLDPLDAPLIDHRYFSDPDGHDRQVALDGVDLAHKLAEAAPVSELATLTPWSGAQREAIAEQTSGYWHPVGTCAMGPVDDLGAVAGADGKVHGLANVYIGDASLMPVIPRANTHLTTVAVAARLAELIR